MLFNEVSDLTIVVKDVNAILGQRHLIPGPLQVVTHLVSSLEKAKDVLEELDTFIRKKIHKPHNVSRISGGHKVTKTRWLLARRHIIEYRGKLKMLREEINSAMQLDNL